MGIRWISDSSLQLSLTVHFLCSLRRRRSFLLSWLISIVFAELVHSVSWGIVLYIIGFFFWFVRAFCNLHQVTQFFICLIIGISLLYSYVL